MPHLEPGNWGLFVTAERYPGSDTEGEHLERPGNEGGATAEGPRQRYVMIKVRQGFARDDADLRTPESMIGVVSGLQDFVHDTLPYIDPSLVELLGTADQGRDALAPVIKLAGHLDDGVAEAMFSDWVKESTFRSDQSSKSSLPTV